MGRAIEIVEAEIQALETQVSLLAEKLQKADSEYLASLSQSVYQQLIMSAYHLCTQVYPELFLKLSFSQTEQLQSQLKNVIKELQSNLTSLKEECHFPLLIKNPVEVIAWQKSLENQISNFLEIASNKANQIIKEIGVFLPYISSSSLEEVSHTDSSNEVMSSVPNLVNIMVQNPTIPEDGTPIITSIQVIQLRIADIEFNNTEVMSGRHQIRHLISKVSNLKNNYQQRQEEKLVVEAENAWRRSWFE